MKNFTLCIALLFSSISFSQIALCGNADVSMESEVLRRETVQHLKSRISMPDAVSIKYVAIKLHLIGPDDGSVYADKDQINQFLANLNRQFQLAGIVYYFSGVDFNYIPNSQIAYSNHTASELSTFKNIHKVDNAINFFVPGAIYINGTPVGGYSSLAPTTQSANDLWITNSNINDLQMTGPHEFGHYFGLPHTFNNSTSSIVAQRELVTRNFNEIAPRLSANCNIAGDFITDTPADNHSGILNAVGGCLHTSTATDMNGDLFSPDTHNYMSYNNCRPYRFTAGQYNKLADGYLIVTNPSNNFSLNAPETVQNAPSNLAATITSYDADYYGSTRLTWNDNSEVETGYIIEISSSPEGPFIPFDGTEPNVTSLEDVEMLPGTANYFRIKASNTKNNYSAVASVTFPELCGNVFQSCELDDFTDFGAYRIENFQLRKQQSGEILIDNSESGCSLNGIGNYYRTISATIAPGESLSFTVDSKEGLNGRGVTMTTAIYVDWNRNNQFEETEMMFVGEPDFISTTGSFTIPDNIPLGDFRLRICSTGLNEIPGPCVTTQGEAEDYKLTNNTLRVNTADFGEVKLYPNPVSSILYIKMPIELEVVKLTATDISGKIIFSDQTGALEIDTQHLSSGIYFLTIDSKSGRHFARFVKN